MREKRGLDCSLQKELDQMIQWPKIPTKSRNSLLTPDDQTTRPGNLSLNGCFIEVLNLFGGLIISDLNT